jgi:hypothetical protein
LVDSQSIGYDGVAPVLPDSCSFANAASVYRRRRQETVVVSVPLSGQTERLVDAKLLQ